MAGTVKKGRKRRRTAKKRFGIPKWFFFLEMEFGNGKGFLKRNL